MKKLIQSFGYSFQGINYCVGRERNFRIHCLAAGAVVVAGIIFSISATEWMMLIICIFLVMALEMLNTAVEQICNMIQPEFSPLIKVIKDVSAGSVTLVALMAAVCGGIIFYS